VMSFASSLWLACAGLLCVFWWHVIWYLFAGRVARSFFVLFCPLYAWLGMATSML